MAQLKIQIKSNHEDGDSYENIISIELNDELLGDFVSSSEIDWEKLNASILNSPDYSSLVKDEIIKTKLKFQTLIIGQQQ